MEGTTTLVQQQRLVPDQIWQLGVKLFISLFIYLFRLHFHVYYVFFFCYFCDVAKMAMTHKNILAKFGKKIHIKVKHLQHLCIFFGYILEPCLKKTQQFFLSLAPHRVSMSKFQKKIRSTCCEFPCQSFISIINLLRLFF